MTQHLYATVLKLAPLVEGRIPTTQGRLVQGAFLELVRSIEPELSAALHAENRRRPYTVSSLGGAGRPRQGHFQVRAGQELRLRFTLLTDQLFATFTQYLLNPPAGKLPALRLGEVDLAITEMLTTPGSDDWAGYSSPAELWERWQSPPEEAHQISLQFASGVVFSRSSNKDGLGRFMEYFPHPEMFFGSMEARWRELTGLPVPLENRYLRDYVRETVVVSRFEMKTVLHHYWGKPQIGGVGRITYELRDTANRELTGFLNLLADFAFFSGVGAKTALGLGQVRRIVD